MEKTETLDQAQAATSHRSFLQAASQPRMLVLLVVFLVIAMGCAGLGRWQLDRAFERAQLANEQQRREVESGGPTSIGEVLAPQQKFPGELIGRTITVAGIFEPERFYVMNRAVDEELGYVVVSGLRVSDDGLDGHSWADLSGAPVLPVVLGWAATLDEAEQVQIPDGQVALRAYLQGPEASGPPPDDASRISSISSAQLINYWGGPIYSAYAVLAESDPAVSSALTLLPRPQIDGGGPGMNLRNLFYAVEWWVFGGFAVALWIRMVRDNAKNRVDPFAMAGIDSD